MGLEQSQSLTPLAQPPGTPAAIQGRYRSPAGRAGFADPDHDISANWLAARDAILEAQRRHEDIRKGRRLIAASGDMSKQLAYVH